MPYYKKYRRPQYRRPYYYSKSPFSSGLGWGNPYWGASRKSNRPLKFSDLIEGTFVMIIGLVLLGSVSSASAIAASSSSSLASIVGKVFGSALAILFVVALIVMGRRIAGKEREAVASELEDSSYDSPDPHTHQNPSSPQSLNSEKHGCKCYMEGLTDGERRIAHRLADSLSYKDYFIFNNMTIPSSYNGSSQIDHLIVSKFGIFVIESKDFKGWIFGDAYQTSWTQSLPGGLIKKQFQNPIHQNWSHIMALRSMFPLLPEDVFQSVVVFTDSSKFKTQPIENVMSEQEVVSYIQKFKAEKISEEHLHMILGKLSFTCQTADISAVQHVENVRSASATLSS